MFGKLFADTKANKKQICSKNLTKSELDAQGFDIDDLLVPFGPPFWIKIREDLDLLNCNRYNAKICFYHFRSPILAPKLIKKLFVLGPILGRHFSHFIWRCPVSFVSKKSLHLAVV